MLFPFDMVQAIDQNDGLAACFLPVSMQELQLFVKTFQQLAAVEPARTVSRAKAGVFQLEDDIVEKIGGFPSRGPWIGCAWDIRVVLDQPRAHSSEVLG